MNGRRRILASVVVIVALLLGSAGAAQAAVTVTRASVSGTTLKLEGRAAASRPITVDGVRMATSSSSGSFKIDRSGYVPPADCTVDVNDGSAAAVTVTLSGCTVAPPSAAPPLTSVALSPTALSEVGSLAVGEVLLAGAATSPVTVALSSSHPGTAPVSVPSVTVAAGSTQAVFTVAYTTAVTTQTSVTISASAGGVTKTALLTINPPPAFAFLTPSTTLGPGFVGTSFVDTASGTTISVTGRVGCIGFDVVAGQLPDGLFLLDPNQGATSCKLPAIAVSGVPTTVQTSTFTLRATDAANGAQATTVVTITINPALGLTITPQLPWSPVVGAFSNLWVTGSGGVIPYTWVRTAGLLPPGMSLVQDNPSGPLVRVTGTPSTAGTFSFTLRLTDAQGSTGVQAFTVTVAPL